MIKNILVTGGTGYIGSHTVVELLNSNYNVSIIDNLKNSKKEVLDRIEQITQKRPTFYKIDLLNANDIDNIFIEQSIDAVIHFAGLKAVGESTKIPLHYYENNIVGTLNLCKIMNKHNVRKIVFSSSATVYGDPYKVPIKEDFPLSATNPYGRTKLMIEQMFRDLYFSDNRWNIALLRYFNPIGAHSSGLIGEDPNGIPNNLMPYIAQVAVGKQKKVSIFGDDYPTIDGTGVRDYIHVVDLAIGHLKALEKLEKGIGVEAYNLGTGHGYSVLQMIRSFEKACGKTIPFKVVGRREGDIATCFANVEKALIDLNWRTTKTIDDMCNDAWNWQSINPNGYK